MRRYGDDELIQEWGADGSVPNAEESTSSPLAEEMSRRDVLRMGIVGLTGLVLARFTASEAQISVRPSFVPCGGTISELPRAFTDRYYDRVLAPFRPIRTLITHLERQGYQFIRERCQAYVSVSDAEEPRLGGILAIIPSFKPFEQASPSHEAWSIVSFYAGCVHTVQGIGVVVDHRHWWISEARVLDLLPNGEIRIITVPRSTLLRGAEATAAAMGDLPSPPGPWDVRFGAPSQQTGVILIPYVYRSLFDRYSTPLYPPGAISRLLRDVSVVTTIHDALRLRVSVTLSNVSWCCSSSTSCNACTSTSSSSASITIE